MDDSVCVGDWILDIEDNVPGKIIAYGSEDRIRVKWMDRINPSLEQVPLTSYYKRIGPLTAQEELYLKLKYT
jgi:hypothetical protein